jgi:hypothetical protein
LNRIIMKNIVKENIGQTAESLMGLKLDFWRFFSNAFILIVHICSWTDAMIQLFNLGSFNFIDWG